mgnify:CR=1 FL=1
MLMYWIYLAAANFLTLLVMFGKSLYVIGKTGKLRHTKGYLEPFNELELGGSLVDPAILAGGIWTALLTTAMGLIVAIPALVSHYFLEKKINFLIALLVLVEGKIALDKLFGLEIN